jgi:hypothetical protein
VNHRTPAVKHEKQHEKQHEKLHEKLMPSISAPPGAVANPSD